MPMAGKQASYLRITAGSWAGLFGLCFSASPWLHQATPEITLPIQKFASTITVTFTCTRENGRVRETWMHTNKTHRYSPLQAAWLFSFILFYSPKPAPWRHFIASIHVSLLQDTGCMGGLGRYCYQLAG
jgi:hypothetical protein